MAFLSPRQIIDGMNLKEGASLVDMGSGSGAYIYEACRVMGPRAKVIAIDIDRDKLKMVKDTAQIGGWEIDTLVCDLEKRIMLADYSTDYIILVNTLHMIENKSGLISECKRIIAPKGQILIVDWKKDFEIDSAPDFRFGPGKELLLQESELQKLMMSHGFTSMRGLPAGEYHYAYLFTSA